MKLSQAGGPTGHRRYVPRHGAPASRVALVIALCVRWLRMAVHLAVAAVVIVVVSHNASSPYPVRPAEGSPSVPQVRSLP